MWSAAVFAHESRSGSMLAPWQRWPQLCVMQLALTTAVRIHVFNSICCCMFKAQRHPLALETHPPMLQGFAHNNNQLSSPPVQLTRMTHTSLVLPVL